MAEDPKDLFAKLTAESDQANAELKSFAGNVRAYYEGLILQGFSEVQAMELTTHFQSSIIFNTLNSNEEDK